MKPTDDIHACSSVDKCRIIDLERIPVGPDGGFLSAVDNSSAPFPVQRVYYLYDIPGDSERGGHSHYTEQRLLLAAAGCFDVTVSDGIREVTFTLSRPYRALYIPPGIWRTLNNFSSGSVCLALSSNRYSEADYVRDYDLFMELTAPKHRSNHH